MKRILILVIVTLLLIPLSVKAQSDKPSIQANLGIRGRWQTGNLNQLGLIPNAAILLQSENISLKINSSYQYLLVENFNPVNDFWTFSVLKWQTKRKIHPIIGANFGFAKSYKIKQSYSYGMGYEARLYEKSDKEYLYTGLLVGYMNFQFEHANSHTGAHMGLLLSSAIPVSDKIFMTIGLKSYHSLKEIDFWGGSSQIMLNYQFKKNLSLNISQDIVFNNQNEPGIKQLNTLMLFGVRYYLFANHKQSK